ncbi:hypothetical protein BC829DRAFT_450029 [Chytridium lagenaria]|nr:hypothetical protein BC829DRAFT_450029 [Chytridium lagenaria]
MLSSPFLIRDEGMGSPEGVTFATKALPGKVKQGFKTTRGFKAGSDLPGMKEELHEAVSLPQMYEAGAPKTMNTLANPSQFTDRSPSSSWQSGYYNSELNEFIHSAVMSTLTERKWFDDGAINILLELDTLGFSDLRAILRAGMAPVNMGNSHWVLLTAELTLDSGGLKIWGATVWGFPSSSRPGCKNFMNIQPSLVACGAFKTNQTYPIEMLSYGVMGESVGIFDPVGPGVWDQILVRKARRDLLDLYDMHGVMEDSDDENIIEAIRVVKYGPKLPIPTPITNLPHEAISGVTYAKKRQFLLPSQASLPRL